MSAGLDRWVIPPAVGAAVCAVLAATPPSGRPGEALRVEALTAPQRGPWLVRVALEAVETGEIRPPGRANVAVGSSTVSVEGRAQGLYAWATIAPSTASRSLTVRSGGHRAQVEVAPFALAVRQTSWPTSALDVRVLGEAMVSEQAATVLVRVPGAARVRIEPEGEEITVSPESAVDACGVARFEVRADALGAPVHVVAEPGPIESRLRLPLRPGGVAVQWRDDSLEALSTSGAGEVYLVSGDASGATSWEARAWSSDGGFYRVRWPVARGVRWAIASSQPDFVETAGLWRGGPAPPAECAQSEASRLWFAHGFSLPNVAAPRLVWDGASHSRERQEQQRGSLRAVGFVGLAVCVLIEAALVLGAGLARDPEGLGTVSETRRTRAGLIAMAVLTLSLAGLAFAVAGLLRVTDGSW